MKKSLSLLLMAVMLCSMFAVFAVPAFAAPKAGVGIVDITSDTDFSNILESLDDNRTIVFNLKKDICVNHEIVIKANNCSILIRVDDTYYSKYGDVKIYPRYLSDDANYRFLNITGNNVKLYFDGHVICRDFKAIGRKFKPESGGAIYVDGDNCLIANALIYNCTAQKNGGSILVDNDGANIRDCTFKNCHAVDGGGGAICVFGVSDCSVYQCSFEGNSCANKSIRIGDGYDKERNHGDDVKGNQSSFADPDTTIQNCTSDSTNASHFYSCKVLPDTERTPMDTGADIFGTDFVIEYSRPDMTAYARNAMQNNKNCDVIRPDIANKTESENKLFTIEGKNAYGALWEVDWQNALTIKAKDGYTITRIEAVVQDKTNYDALSIDNGTKADRTKDNPNYYGDPIAKDYIAVFEDINAKSVTFTTKGSIDNWRTVPFTDFIIYYTEGDPESRPVIEESPEYTRDGETYDVFTFDRDTYTAGSGGTKSELKGFTLTDTAVPARGHIYGWATDITITAPEGYTITRIEGKPVHFENNVAFLKSNAGTIENQGKPLAKDGIVRINDINASSVEISCTSDYVEFGEFLVFYEKNATLGSVFSGGTLWIIIGVAAAAVAAAVVIVVVKKKKKPATADGAAIEKNDEEDE